MAGGGFGTFMDFAGSAFNDGANIATGIAGAVNAGDWNNRLIESYRGVQDMRDLTPEQLQIVADQIGVPVNVLASQIRSDQVNALRQMQNIASKGGMDDSAILANQQARMESARQNNADNQAIQNSMQRRGLTAGSGAEIAAKQNSAQQAYNTNAMEGALNAQAAQMRALQAIQGSGRLAGDIASQEEERNASNLDRRMAADRYNSSVRNAANQFNSQQILNAQNSNLGRRTAQMNAASQGAGNYPGLDQRIQGDTEKAGEHTQSLFSNIGSLGGM